MGKLIKLFAITLILGMAIVANADKVVATYGNDNKITDEDMTKWIRFNTGGSLPGGKSSFSDLEPKMQDQLIKQYVIQKELLNEANNSKIQKSNIFQQQLESAKDNLLIKLYLDHYAQRKMTSSMLKTEYRNLVKFLKSSDELEISHILIGTEADANDAYKNLSKGESFEIIAQKISLDKQSKENGGKVGKISRGQVFPKYEEVAYSLKPGEYSKPFQTEFGWFIIRVNEKVKRKIPSFDEIKPQLEMQAKERLMQEYLIELEKKSNIKFNQ